MIAIVRFWILAFFALSSMGALGGGSPEPDDARFRHFVNEYLRTSRDSISWQNLAEFAEKMGAKRQSLNDDHSFLKILYARVHTKFLKEYTPYTSFANVLSKGRYNCLTGVAIYALLLDRFGYDYQIVETNYHIFLLVSTGRGTVLLEATDPVDGFVTGKEAIEQRIAQYRLADYDPQGDPKSAYAFTFDLYRKVTLPELTGLLYFNLAVEAFNHGKIEESRMLIRAASAYYHSERIDEFSRIILKTAGRGLRSGNRPASGRETQL